MQDDQLSLLSAKIDNFFTDRTIKLSQIENEISKIHISIEKLEKTNVLLKDRVRYLMKKKDLIELDLKDLRNEFNNFGTFNWIKQFSKIIPYLILVGLTIVIAVSIENHTKSSIYKSAKTAISD